MPKYLIHYGVRGMRWKEHIKGDHIKPVSRWKKQAPLDSNSVTTDNRLNLVKQLRTAKRLTGLKTKNLALLSNEQIRKMLNSDLMKKKLSEAKPKNLERIKKLATALPILKLVFSQVKNTEVKT